MFGYIGTLQSLSRDRAMFSIALTTSGLKEAFNKDLSGASDDRQFIIIENVPPIVEIARSDQTIEFTGSNENGRFGLFPK